MSVDIFILKKNTEDIYDIDNRYDYSNLKVVKTNTLSSTGTYETNSENDFSCNVCRMRCIYITHEGKCPKCSYETHKLKCNYCYKHIGCVSCGGIHKNMIRVDKKVFCRTNRCLMPFGFFINYKESKCICVNDIRNFVYLCNDITNYINKFLEKNKTCWDKKRKLPDLSYTNPSNCVHCQLQNKYTDVSHINPPEYENIICNCYN